MYCATQPSQVHVDLTHCRTVAACQPYSDTVTQTQTQTQTEAETETEAEVVYVDDKSVNSSIKEY